MKLSNPTAVPNQTAMDYRLADADWKSLSRQLVPLDTLSDALADCYTFLLRKHRGQCQSWVEVPAKPGTFTTHEAHSEALIAESN